MSDPSDGGSAAPGERLAELARSVEALSARVEALEQRSRPEPRVRSEARTVAAAAAPTPPLPASPARSERPTTPPAHQPEAQVVTVPWSSHPVATPARAAGRAPGWRVGPLRNVGAERLPVVLMGAAGGVALLMGVLYFAWYSIQQGWISPEVRLLLTGLFGLCALAGAWRLAARGQTTVAAALGGAGLGGWFGATLVARHAHGLVGAEGAFALLVFGAALGMAIAVHQRLRLLATLAALGAFLTPLAVAEGTDRLHELMAYQLVVVAFLYLIESKRRWPELGAIAVLGSWGLFVAWAAEHLGDSNRAGAVAWSFALLVVGHAQAWQLVRGARLSPWIAAPRLWVNGYVAWTLAGVAARGHEAAWVGLGMAALNLCTAIALLRVRTSPSVGGGSDGAARPVVYGFWWRAGIAACLSVAWLQVFAFAPLRLEDDQLTLWWFAMAALVTVQLIRTRRYAYLSPFLLPWLAALVASASQTGTTSTVLGFSTAALPLCFGLWPTRTQVARSHVTLDWVLGAALWAGCAAWAVMASHHLERDVAREGWILALCLAAAVPMVLRLVVAPTMARCGALLVALFALTWLATVFAFEGGLLRPATEFGPERTWQIGAVVGVAALAFLIVVRFRARLEGEPETAWVGHVHDISGVLVVGALLLVALHLVAGSVPSLTSDPSNAGSLVQAGFSVCGAVAGLFLLVRGLLARRSTWTRVGMLALFATSAKLAAVDLLQVSMIWRVLSFVGLGACLLLGAYAYRRLGDWVEREQSGVA